MPVRTQKSDTMLSHQYDHNIWDETSSPYANLDEDDWNMKLLDVDTPEFYSNGFEAFDGINMDLSEILTAPPSPKYQIRHHDCMWSGTCVDKSHPSKKRGMNICPASTSTTSQQPQNETCPTTVLKQTDTTNKFSIGKSIMTSNNILKNIACKDKIPAGRSLLINPRVNTNTAPTKATTMIQQNKDAISINGSNKDFDTIINIRPDTPLSLGDDVPEFKSNIDLTPCPSSNRVKFDASSTKIINMLAEHLEETSNSLNDTTPFIGGYRNQRLPPSDLNEILKDITYLSDYEELGDDSSAVDMEDDENSDEIEYKSSTFSKHSSSVLPQATTSRTISHHSDHSYTRPKGSAYDLNKLGVQTPSDSEEEIDVVNISEKNLPTNPSARDRRALQNTVASKIARSKHSNQRRRVSDDDSISSSTSTLSSKGSTPIKIGSQTPQRCIFTSRKRKDHNNNMHDSHKKYRHGHSKKQRLSHSKHQKMMTVDPDEADTVEKRNLHNNMERQRRIGLKNLFEELKCQIPSLKDKERAPKVNILREAAVYCKKLRYDEDLHAELTRKHNRLVTRVRNLKASIAAQQRRNY